MINPSYLSMHSVFTSENKTNLILYIPALCPGNVDPNKPEIQVDKSHQWDTHAHPDIDRWWIKISVFTQQPDVMSHISPSFIQVFLIPVSWLYSLHMRLIRGFSGCAVVVTRWNRPRLDSAWSDKELRVFHACIFWCKVCCVLLRSIDLCRATSSSRHTDLAHWGRHAHKL